MRKWPLLLLLLGMPLVGHAQNIVEALQLKADSIGAYTPGESMPNDTLVDLQNGYYEAFLSHHEDHKFVVRQAALFRNRDGSKTLGISTTEWAFACFDYATNFYEIAPSGDRIHSVSNDSVLPVLSIREFLADSTVLSVLNTYLPVAQQSRPEDTVTLDQLLVEVYDIAYVLPRIGTSLTATLKFCDHVPDYLEKMTSDEYEVLESNFTSLNLEYDRTRKIFKRK